MNSTFRFISAYPEAELPVRADATAFGTIPSKAMRYCEAMRVASSFGWYVYPARSVTLMYDGHDVYIESEESNWETLVSEHVADPDEWWNDHCPGSLHDMAPPFISSIGVPGYVQIWSGMLVQTKQDWSTLIRPIANTVVSGQYYCFEGIVETDHYAPTPLFINLRLLRTDVPITISADEPLFQVQPIHRSCYSSGTLGSVELDNLQSMSDTDWKDYRKTVRSVDPQVEDHTTGQYGVKARKRAKQES